ncbi:hypothetical protein GBF38_001619 [Nibea albiflora]|uniref:Uncharacterized protein n=1 Tax=Nibea albiflora TaxID=240163 RepID=A0ACB7EUR5_NIBAL|nr:hypothetical protein GBF38_001619 [Nibea albiflora]
MFQGANIQQDKQRSCCPHFRLCARYHVLLPEKRTFGYIDACEMPYQSRKRSLLSPKQIPWVDSGQCDQEASSSFSVPNLEMTGGK